MYFYSLYYPTRHKQRDNGGNHRDTCCNGGDFRPVDGIKKPWVAVHVGKALWRHTNINNITALIICGTN